MYEKGCLYLPCISQISNINDFVKLKNLRNNEPFFLFTYKHFSQIHMAREILDLISVGCSQGFYYVFGPKLLMLETQI